MYFDLFVEFFVVFVDSWHVVAGEEADLIEYLGHGVLDKGICVEIDGRHYLKIFLDLIQNFMLVKDDRPGLNPTRHRKSLLNSK
jgi:hypothetical protein